MTALAFPIFDTTRVIDLTEPFQWPKVVDRKGYVHYRIYREGSDRPAYEVSLPVANPECQFIGKTRVIEDYLLKANIRLVLEDGEVLNAHVVGYPDL